VRVAGILGLLWLGWLRQLENGMGGFRLSLVFNLRVVTTFRRCITRGG
jgi:hypothetical protein